MSNSRKLGDMVDSTGNLTLHTTGETWHPQSNAIELGELSIEDYVVGGSNATNILFNGYRGTDNTFKRKVDGSSAAMGSYLGDISFSTYASGTAGDTLTSNIAVRIKADGNVGIGTIDPGQKLTVQSDSVGVTRVSVINTGNAAAGSGIQLITKNGSTWTSNATIRTDNAGNFSIFGGAGTSEPELLRINSSGNVGIGATNPQANLDVEGVNSTIRISDNTFFSTWPDEQEIGTLEFWTNDSSGNAPYDTAFIKVRNDASGGTLPSGALTFGTSTYNSVTGAEERARIDSVGRFGLGTNSPEAKMHVYDENAYARYQRNSTQYVDIGTNDNGQHFVFGYGSNDLLLGTDANARTTIKDTGVQVKQRGARLHKVDFQLANSNFDNPTFTVVSNAVKAGTYPQISAVIELHGNGVSANRTQYTKILATCEIDGSNNLINLATTVISHSVVGLAVAAGTVSVSGGGMYFTPNRQTNYDGYTLNTMVRGRDGNWIVGGE